MIKDHSKRSLIYLTLFSKIQSDVLTRYTQKEHQAQTLYSANDYIQHTDQAERYVCSEPGVLETFPELDGMICYKILTYDLTPIRNLNAGFDEINYRLFTTLRYEGIKLRAS